MNFETCLKEYFSSIKGTEKEKMKYKFEYFVELKSILIENSIKNIPVSNLQDLETFYTFLQAKQVKKVQELKDKINMQSGSYYIEDLIDEVFST